MNDGRGPFANLDISAVLLRLLTLVLLGTLTYGAVLAEAQPVLVIIAGAGGGWLAHRAFAWVRGNAGLQAWIDATFATGPQPFYRVWGASALAWVFYSTATAALSVAVLGFVISGLATGGLLLISGHPINEAWAACVSFVFSQVQYFRMHPDPAPVVTVENTGNAEHGVEFTWQPGDSDADHEE